MTTTIESIAIPTPSGNLQIDLPTGTPLFVLGANGTGKSALMSNLAMTSDNTYLASAHRTVWMNSAANELSATEYAAARQTIAHRMQSPDVRWSNPDRHVRSRAATVLTGLHTVQRLRDRRIVNALESGSVDTLQRYRDESMDPIHIINGVLKAATMPISVSLDAREEHFVASKGDATYPVNELSDGERNAFLLAGAVVTEDAGTLFLIDEPERHLHRSIICPLLQAVFDARPDCRFVVATHELTLPLYFPESKVLILRRCIFNASHPAAWDADLTRSTAKLEEVLKIDIWGGRRTLLFVEGEPHSLDAKLYRLLFPNITVYAKGNVTDVQNAVASINEASEFTWVTAHGLLDGDRVSQETRDTRLQDSVYTLESCAVESLYYHPTVQGIVAEHRCKRAHKDLSRCLDLAAQKVTEIHDRRTQSGVVTRMLGDSYSDSAKQIITRYAIKKTDIPHAIATSLGFKGRKDYENALLDRLVTDSRLRDAIFDADEGLQRLRDSISE